MAYICKSFRIEELVSEKTYSDRGVRAWQMFDDKILITIDAIKARFPQGSMTINNWLWSGDRQYSGYREPGSPWYSQYSMHSFGKAMDSVFSDYDTEEVRTYVLNNPEEFSYVTGIEMGVSWLHVDCRNSYDLLKFGK